jgi:hypothetical protein
LKQPGSLEKLIRRARRRHLVNVAFKQSVLAVCAAAAGLILLLLLGTQILDWYWVLALFTAGLAVGLRNLRRQILPPYRIAQSIDRRVGLSDSLSTAFYYSSLQSNRRGSEEIRAAQYAEADRLAREVPLERAAPLQAPRSLYALGVLLLAASGLLTLRYGIFRSLDLRPPLATTSFDAFHFIAQAAKPEPENPKTKDKRLNELLKEYGLSLEDEGQKRPAEENSKSEAGSQSAESESDAKEQRQASTQQLDPGDERNDETSDDAEGREGSQGDRMASNQTGPRDNSSAQASRNRQSDSSAESNSLLDKFRDAMQSLLSRLKTQPRPGETQQAARAQGRTEMGEARQMQNQQGRQTSGKQMSGQPAGQPQGEQQGEGTEQAQGGPGKQGGSESEEASQQGRTGIGKEDGSKDIKEAEQLAAMGKISEIIGRRSQNLTGEVMVEVASGKQQLRTAYSRQDAAHTEAGGAINRDEIPLAYQRYVQQYFEEIRKAPPARK